MWLIILFGSWRIQQRDLFLFLDLATIPWQMHFASMCIINRMTGCPLASPCKRGGSTGGSGGLTISSNWVWICRWTSAIWNRTSPKKIDKKGKTKTERMGDQDTFQRPYSASAFYPSLPVYTRQPLFKEINSILLSSEGALISGTDWRLTLPTHAIHTSSFQTVRHTSARLLPREAQTNS